MVSKRLTIYRTHDMDLVKLLWGDKRIYSAMRDDGCPISENWHPVDSPKRYFLVPTLDSIPIGIVAYYALSFVICEAHIGLSPVCLGVTSKDIALMSAEWLFNNTPCQKIIAFVPVNKPHVYKFALKCGMQQDGFLSKSFLSDGMLIDQYIMSLGK